jgi:hypothetical protein
MSNKRKEVNADRSVLDSSYPDGDGYWNVHTIDISQERVDETAKREHEFECPRCGHCCQQREWVGLTRLELDIATLGLEDLGDCYLAIEAKLKEKNSE